MSKYVELLKSVRQRLCFPTQTRSSWAGANSDTAQKLAAVNDEASKKYLAELEGELTWADASRGLANGAQLLRKTLHNAIYRCNACEFS